MQSRLAEVNLEVMSMILVRFSERPFRLGYSTSKLSQQEHRGGGVEEGFGAFDACIEVFCQSPVAVNLGEGCLDMR